MKKGFMIQSFECQMICPAAVDLNNHSLLEDGYFGASRTFQEGGMKLKIEPVIFRQPFQQSEKPIWNAAPIVHGYAVSRSDCNYLLNIDGLDVTSEIIHDAIIAGLAVLRLVEPDHLWVLDLRGFPKDRRAEAIHRYSWRHRLTQPFNLFAKANIRLEYEDDEWLWALLMVLLRDVRLRYAAHFLNQSLKSFYPFGLEHDLIDRPDDFPMLVSEAVELENSVHNCLKVAEALYGGTFNISNKKKHDRIKKRFKEIGIDADANYGFSDDGKGPESFIEKLANLELVRNERSAHGGISTAENARKITYFEAMDYQYFASSMLRAAILHRYPSYRKSENSEWHSNSAVKVKDQS